MFTYGSVREATSNGPPYRVQVPVKTGILYVKLQAPARHVTLIMDEKTSRSAVLHPCKKRHKARGQKKNFLNLKLIRVGTLVATRAPSKTQEAFPNVTHLPRGRHVPGEPAAHRTRSSGSSYPNFSFHARRNH